MISKHKLMRGYTLIELLMVMMMLVILVGTVAHIFACILRLWQDLAFSIPFPLTRVALVPSKNRSA